MIFLHTAMYNRFIFYPTFSSGGMSTKLSGIHQLELEYNNESFIEPLYKAYSGPADPLLKTKKKISRKKFLAIIPTGREQNGKIIILNCFLR